MPDAKRSKFTYRHLAQLANYSADSPLRVIAHIDLDAFYAQVESKRLSLPPDEPLAVQQWQNLIAVNYAARAHNVSRHETAASALTRCPSLRLVHVATWRCGDTHWAYREAPNISNHKACLDPYRIESKKILEVFRSACPRVEKASIDESFLDLSGMVHERLLERYEVLRVPGESGVYLPLPELEEGGMKWGGAYVLPTDGEDKEGKEGEGMVDWDDVVMNIAAGIVDSVRERVKVEVGYTCSAGIAGNKMLAKLGSGYKKPNAQTVVRPAAAQPFLNTLEFTKIRNLGGKLGSQITALFSTTALSSLLSLSLQQLTTKLPPQDATWLFNIIRGLDASPVNPRTTTKSMLSAKSFRPSITTPEQATSWLRVFVADIHARIVEDEGGRWPSSMTIMHRSVREQKTRQTAMGGKGGVESMLVLAEGLLKGVVGEGGAWPCSGLSLQVGGFQDKESGSRGITGFLVKRPAEAVDRESKRPKKEGEEGDELPPPPPPPPPNAEAESPNPPQKDPSPPPQEEIDTYTCAQCHASIPLDTREEHQDWHFAKALVEQDRAAERERIKAEKAAQPPPPPPPPLKKGPKKGGGGGGKKGTGGGLEKGQSKLAFGKS